MASHGSCFMVAWNIFKNDLLRGRPNTKPGEPCHSERSQLLICSILSCVRTLMNRNSLKYHLVESSVTYDFTLSFGLSRFHGHNSWLVCEVALSLDGYWTRPLLHGYGKHTIVTTRWLAHRNRGHSHLSHCFQSS